VSLSCAVLAPVAVPYREPLFALLAQRPSLRLRVIYGASAQPSWDQPRGWFSSGHPYDALALSSSQRGRAGRTPIVFPRGLGPALSDFDPDVVVSWEYGPTTLRALVWCIPRGRPLVIFSELPPAANRELPAAQLRLHRLLARRAAAGFVVASSAARRRTIALGADPAAVQVSLQSADVGAFAAVERPERPRRPVRLLYAGRLVADKNLPRLVRALAATGLSEDDAVLELCGTGPLEAELRELARELRAPLRVRGYVAPEELPEAFAAADALVLPSLYEPFGVAVREAAAAGLAVVCSREAGAAGDFAVAGRNALLVDPRSERSLADALAAVVCDDALRERMGAQSRAISGEHPLADDAEAFARAVSRAAGAAPRRPAG